MNKLKVRWRTRYLNGFGVLPHKGEKSNFKVKKSSGYHLNQVIRVKVIGPGADQNHVPPNSMQQGHSVPFVVFLPKMPILNLTTKNHHTNPIEGYSTQKLACNLQKCQCCEQKGKAEKLFRLETEETWKTVCDLGPDPFAQKGLLL